MSNGSCGIGIRFLAPSGQGQLRQPLGRKHCMAILRRSYLSKGVCLIVIATLGAYMLASQFQRLTMPAECAKQGPSTGAQTPSSRCHPGTYFNVSYIQRGDPRQVLDVYLPSRGDGPHPTLLTVHGGGFLGGNKDDLAPFARQLVQQGYAVVLAEYRLAPEYTYPSQVQDVFCALGWLYANAGTYDFNSDQVVAIGESVGGSLAAMLGIVDDPRRYLEGCSYGLPEGKRLQGVITFYPVTNFALAAYDSFFVPYLGVLPEQDPERWAEASVLSEVEGSEPPFLVVHGSWDARVPLSESRNLVEALRAHQVAVDFVVMPHADHGFISEAPESTAGLASIEAINAFFEMLNLRLRPADEFR